MIFLTVGTSPFQFNRLLEIVDLMVRDALIDDSVFGQIGFSSYKPKFFEYSELVEKDEFDEKFESAAGIISHAGMGTILAAMTMQKPIVIVPRQKKYREHVNDHQVSTAAAMVKSGAILIASDRESLIKAIEDFRTFVPICHESSADKVALRIGDFIDAVSAEKKPPE